MSKLTTFLKQICGAAAFPAKTSALAASAVDSKPTEAASIGCGTNSCESVGLNGYSSKMFPDFSLRRVKNLAQTLPSFSHRWTKSGMVWRGECWTLSFSDSPNNASACSLLDVLEDHAHQRHFLSVKACRGILRRSKERGVKLPMDLRRALIDGSQTKTPMLSQNHTTGGSRTGEPPNVLLPRRLTPLERERIPGYPDNFTRLIRPAAKPSGTP